MERMNKRGKIVTEILVMMVLIVLTSAVILLLVQSGVISVKADVNQADLLNTDFVPYGREGSLVISEFHFCTEVTASFDCLSPKESFSPGDKVHFFFVAESTTSNGEIIIVENYRLRAPNGDLLLDVEGDANFQFDLTSRERQEEVKFKDYFVVADYLEGGEYTLELVLENPLLNKKVNAVEKFRLE